jgi:IclR family mhp operon transcriptional activator
MKCQMAAFLLPPASRILGVAMTSHAQRENIMHERQEVKSLKKALRALTFLNCNGESTVTEVACAIGVPRTTSYRLLETLAAEGYVEKQQHSHIYRLTSMVQKLSSGFGDSDLVVEVAKPRVNRVGEAVRWPLALATPMGSDMVVRVATDHDTPLAIDRYCIGFRTPMLHAPSGLCYLAFCDADKRASILEMARRDSPSSERDINPDYMFDQIREQGFCHRRYAQYREAGLAVPLFADGRVVGGIVMRYTKSTMKAAQLEERYVPIVRDLAADISAAYDRRLARDLPETEDEPSSRREPDKDLFSKPIPFTLAAAAPVLGRRPALGDLQRASR